MQFSSRGLFEDAHASHLCTACFQANRGHKTPQYTFNAMVVCLGRITKAAASKGEYVIVRT